MNIDELHEEIVKRAITPKRVADLSIMVAKGEISYTGAKKALRFMVDDAYKEFWDELSKL